jgi:hypothetical protein
VPRDASEPPSCAHKSYTKVLGTIWVVRVAEA